MRYFLAVCGLLFAGEACACIRNPIGYSFEDKINNEFAYLICLHNEQNDLINKQNAVINEQADQIERLVRAVRAQDEHNAAVMEGVEDAKTLGSRALAGVDIAKEDIAIIDKYLEGRDGSTVIPDIPSGTYTKLPDVKN